MALSSSSSILSSCCISGKVNSLPFNGSGKVNCLPFFNGNHGKVNCLPLNCSRVLNHGKFINCLALNGCRVNNLHAAAMSHLVSSFSTSNPSTPWLMLPPSFKDDHKYIYNNNMVLFPFYSLAQDKVLGFTSTRLKKLMIRDDVKLISSSHGWLTLFNPLNWDLFLFNPLSDRHIKLPPIQNLLVPTENLEIRLECITKLITSCSPEDEDCRVMMSYGPDQRLAFCCPTSSTEWTPIGAPFIMDEDNDFGARDYEDFVYSSTEKLFYTITGFDEEMEIWDLQDIKSPKVIPFDFYVDEENFTQAKFDRKLDSYHLYLVKAEESGQLYMVRRYIEMYMAPDGSSVDIDKVDEMDLLKFPSKTIGFDVLRYDPEEGEFIYMDKGCLDGLAIFVGANHSFAIDVASANSNGHKEILKPNSIYFTDSSNLVLSDEAFGGHDIGIFNYKDQTFSPCYYPCDLQSFKKIIPAPMWFTPTYY